MKPVHLLFVILWLPVSFSVTAGSNELASDGISIVKSGAVIKVFYLAAGNRYIKVAMLDNKGNIIFSEVVKCRNGFTRSYNISNLASGKYLVRVSGSNGVHNQVFEIAG